LNFGQRFEEQHICRSNSSQILLKFGKQVRDLMYVNNGKKDVKIF